MGTPGDGELAHVKNLIAGSSPSQALSNDLQCIGPFGSEAEDLARIRLITEARSESHVDRRSHRLRPLGDPSAAIPVPTSEYSSSSSPKRIRRPHQAVRVDADELLGLVATNFSKLLTAVREQTV